MQSTRVCKASLIKNKINMLYKIRFRSLLASYHHHASSGCSSFCNLNRDLCDTLPMKRHLPVPHTICVWFTFCWSTTNHKSMYCYPGYYTCTLLRVKDSLIPCILQPPFPSFVRSYRRLLHSIHKPHLSLSSTTVIVVFFSFFPFAFEFSLQIFYL